MKPLVLTLKKRIKFRLDASFLTINNAKNPNDIKNLKIPYGRKACKLTDFFKVEGADIRNIIIKSSTDKIDNIGCNMSNMNITVFGNVGNSFGKEMCSGLLKLHGNALNYVGSGIKGGSIFLYGHAGKFLCSKPIGKNEGIVDGLVYINGNVGDHSIQNMRRGIIIINGNLGNYCCDNMISGSVLIKGKIGNNFCNDIKRGTIITTQKNVTSQYIPSYNRDVNFFRFFIKQLSFVIGKKIFSDKFRLKKYYGRKDSKNLSEVFLISK